MIDPENFKKQPEQNPAIIDIRDSVALSAKDAATLRDYDYLRVGRLTIIADDKIDEAFEEIEGLSLTLEGFKKLVADLRYIYPNANLPCREDGGRDGSGMMINI